MVLADGVIEASELQALYKIGLNQYNLTQEEVISAVKQSGVSFQVPNSFAGKIEFLCNMANIALADGVLDDTERKLMNKYIVRMGFKEENATKIADFIFDNIKQGATYEEVAQKAIAL